MKSNWILIGYMGCGKTTVGRYLAKTLKVDFIDTDAWIERKHGCSISQIFAARGEEAFRDMETACLRELIETGSRGVFSAGGGLPLREENRKLLRQLGRVVYLQARPETIYKRVKHDTSRPLLQTADPEKRIIEMLKERTPFYLDAAELAIQVDGKTFEEIVCEMLK